MNIILTQDNIGSAIAPLKMPCDREAEHLNQ